MKRIIAAILSVVMVLSLLTAQAFAAGKEMKVSVTGVKDLNAIEEGQTITVSVKLPENTSMAGATFELTYDADYFEVTNATSDLIGSDEISKKAGKVVVAYLNTQMKNANFTKNQNMLTVALKATGKVGTSSITLTKQDCGALDGSKLIDYGYTAPAATSVTTVAKTVAVTSVTVSSNTLNLEVGQTRTLTATVTPDNATDKTVTWKSSNANVATVDENGVVTAVSEGTAKITATAGGKTSKACTVTVAVPPCDHSAGTEHHEAVPATCTDKGSVEYYECKTCHVKFADSDCKTPIKGSIETPALGHKVDDTNLTYHEYKAPNCKEDGNIEYWTCETCKGYFKLNNKGKLVSTTETDVKLASTGEHNWEFVEESKKNGYTLRQFKCSGCNTVEWDAFVGCVVSVTLVKDEKIKGDLKDADVTVTGNDGSIKMSEDETAVIKNVNIADVIGTGVDEDAAIAALKEKLENTTFTVKATAKKSGWNFKTVKTEVKFVITDNGVQAVVKDEDSGELVPVEKLSFTITGKKNTTPPSGGGSTTTDTTKNDGKKVESGKTFDAGIAMYVGLSVLSVTGGALVIGKKKERF